MFEVTVNFDRRKSEKYSDYDPTASANCRVKLSNSEVNTTLTKSSYA